MGIPGALEFFVNETENYLMKNDSLQHIGWLTWFPNDHSPRWISAIESF